MYFGGLGTGLSSGLYVEAERKGEMKDKAELPWATWSRGDTTSGGGAEWGRTRRVGEGFCFRCGRHIVWSVGCTVGDPGVSQSPRSGSHRQKAVELGRRRAAECWRLRERRV